MDVPSLLESIAKLLSQHNQDEWAASFWRFRDGYRADPTETKGSIRHLFYGGMGSFNDLVLHDGGVPLRSENDELDRLRAALFQACNK